MLKSISIFFASLLSILFVGCSSKKTNKAQVLIQGDTLKIITEVKGDTVFKHFVRLDNKQDENYKETRVYRSMVVDTTIQISNVSFPEGDLEIYFDKAKVAVFCDSLIKEYDSPIEVGGDFGHWSYLRGIAQSNNQMEFISASWLPTLFERFAPLIINRKTKQKANRILREKFFSKYYGCRRYLAITATGDTVFLATETDYYELQDIK